MGRGAGKGSSPFPVYWDHSSFPVGWVSPPGWVGAYSWASEHLLPAQGAPAGSGVVLCASSVVPERGGCAGSLLHAQLVLRELSGHRNSRQTPIEARLGV